MVGAAAALGGVTRMTGIVTISVWHNYQRNPGQTRMRVDASSKSSPGLCIRVFKNFRAIVLIVKREQECNFGLLSSMCSIVGCDNVRAYWWPLLYCTYDACSRYE